MSPSLTPETGELDGLLDRALPTGSEPALGPKVVKLSADMVGFGGSITEIRSNDSGGSALTASDNQRRFCEGVWVHKYDSTYYLSYSTGDTHHIVYATSSSPTVPFAYRGRVLDPANGWTTHHSIVEFNGMWYLLYHDNQLSGVDNQRCVKVAELTHNSDGTIPVISP
jgi:hypothetical protein